MWTSHKIVNLYLNLRQDSWYYAATDKRDGKSKEPISLFLVLLKSVQDPLYQDYDCMSTKISNQELATQLRTKFPADTHSFDPLLYSIIQWIGQRCNLILEGKDHDHEYQPHYEVQSFPIQPSSIRELVAWRTNLLLYCTRFWTCLLPHFLFNQFYLMDFVVHPSGSSLPLLLFQALFIYSLICFHKHELLCFRITRLR